MLMLLHLVIDMTFHTSTR